MDGMFGTIMSLLNKGLTAAGALVVVWGAVTVGRSLKDSNGPGLQNGIMEIVGGGIIIAAAVFVNSISM